VNNRYTQSLSLAALLLPLALYGGDVQVLRGRVVMPARDSAQGLFVGMEEMVTHSQVHRVDLTLDGSFEFRGVPTGEYVLHVTNIHGEAVYQQFVTVHEHMDDLRVALPDSGKTPSKAGKVSVRQLLHPPDKKAVQAFHAAGRLSESGKYADAVSELERAIKISPEFGQAYTNLAVQHMYMQRYEEAVTETKRAMEIGGPDPLNLCNMAFAQYQLHQFAESEEAARAALRLDSGYLQAHLVLGSVLARNPAARFEAMEHLKEAATRFPSAQKTLDALRAAR
jgi:tetratricopeptide (TPR) repeat protein